MHVYIDFDIFKYALKKTNNKKIKNKKIYKMFCKDKWTKKVRLQPDFEKYFSDETQNRQ